mmetsp:Transcript_6443/g.18441  ORF Transcript_6443/g.18441 Transcript_6443/m.18441 type:complete len:194 (-) Transcript_6443:164-745(-)
MCAERIDNRIRGAQNQAAERRCVERGVSTQFGATVAVTGGGGPFLAETFVGRWADSLGNAVTVSSEDAYELRLSAVLSNPPRKDIYLTIRPVPGGGWTCGNAMLDPAWSTSLQLHWLTADGRISAWVRVVPPSSMPQDDEQQFPQELCHSATAVAAATTFVDEQDGDQNGEHAPSSARSTPREGSSDPWVSER